MGSSLRVALRRQQAHMDRAAGGNNGRPKVQKERYTPQRDDRKAGGSADNKAESDTPLDSLRIGQIRKDRRGRVQRLFVIDHIGERGGVSGSTITIAGQVDRRMFERKKVEELFPFIMWSPEE